MSRNHSFRRRLALAVILTGFGLGAVAEASGKPARIMAKDKRGALLEATQGNLNMADPTLASRIGEARSPFVVYREEPKPVVEARPVSTVTPTDVRLPDAVVLKAFARSFRVKGVMNRGDQSLLSLRNGALVSVGASKTLSLRGQQYEVVIESISTSGYTLRLGEAVLRQSLEEGPTEGTVILDQPSQ